MPEPEALLEMTSDIVTAMVSNNKLSADELPGLIGSVYASIAALGQAPTTDAQGSKPEAAVSIRKSLTDPEVIISMIDGKPYKMLTRHLRTQGYTPDSYRKTFGLNPDYPMVAAAYSTKRRALAKSFGLGRTKALAAPPEAVVGEPISEPAAATKAAAAKKPRRSRKAAPEQGAAF